MQTASASNRIRSASKTTPEPPTRPLLTARSHRFPRTRVSTLCSVVRRRHRSSNRRLPSGQRARALTPPALAGDPAMGWCWFVTFPGLESISRSWGSGDHLVRRLVPVKLCHDHMRGQLEPTAALIATATVCLSLGVYAVALGNAIPIVDRNHAEPTLDRVEEALSTGGTTVPDRRRAALRAGPTGYSVNLTITIKTRRWFAGPAVPDAADHARRQTSVRAGPTRVRAGTLRVAVWS
jgi:hypothetical protein